MLQNVALLAESSLPVGKGIGMVLFFGGVGLFSTIAAFQPSRTLHEWASVIGTKNPRVARTVCALGAIVGWGAVAVAVAALMGGLD